MPSERLPADTRSPEIRRLLAADVEDYRTIRLDTLKRAADFFGAVHEVEAARPLADFTERLASLTVFGAYLWPRTDLGSRADLGPHIVGAASFRREAGAKTCHKGVLGGVYVQPEARGRGIAAALVGAVIDHARSHVERLNLAVVQGNDPAIGLYLKLGFEVYGIEPRARKNPGGYVDKVLMALDLRAAPGAAELQRR